MSRSSYHDIGAAMAYGQACTVLEAFDGDQLLLIPVDADLIEEWRGIRRAALDEMRDIGAKRAAFAAVRAGS